MIRVIHPPAIRQVAVRCCCQPKRLLGWFLLHTHHTRLEAGQVVRFRMRPELLSLDHDPFWRGGEFLELPLAIYVDEQGVEHLAFRADHDAVPYEQLLRADGFFTAN